MIEANNPPNESVQASSKAFDKSLNKLQLLCNPYNYRKQNPLNLH